MNTAERRGEILKILHNADAPVAARELAGRFGVSRQVIVQDLAVIRPQSGQGSGGAESDRGLWRSCQKYKHQPPCLRTSYG